MKKITYIFLSILLLGHVTSCKKFLDVVPIDNLAGNSFWKNKEDVEAFTLGIYNKLRATTMTETRFFPVTGDLRCAPVFVNSEHTNSNQFIVYLKNNNLGALLADSRYAEPSGDGSIWKITMWNSYYEVIQLANILNKKLDEIPEGMLTQQESILYRAEAIFLRNLSYFFLVRLYGDVPYYTNAYNETALERTNMVEVLTKCADDLKSVKDELPWTYDDDSKVAVRVNKGAVIALLMHINMWKAGFDRPNRIKYYEETAALGGEVMEQNQGTYELLPLSQTKEVFSGRSKEGLFEIVQSMNLGEQFTNNTVFSNYVVKRPYQSANTAIFYYDINFIRKLFPPGEVDNRVNLWFDENLYSIDGSQQMLKFLNPFTGANGVLSSNVGNQIVFRYTDMVLLRAEALAQLGRDAEARPLLNLIRKRAGAVASTASEIRLKDDIYWERVKELLGEGHYFYDLVRTGKLVDPAYSFAPISTAAFNEGAWTWPINKSALTNNPYLTLNQYWN